MKAAPMRRASAGFTLVELMISMALGLIIILALITMLINVNKNNTELGNSNRLIENGRFAVQLLASDLQHAGFWAGHMPSYDDLTVTGVPQLDTAGGDIPTEIPNPCLTYASWDAAHIARMIGIHVAGSNVPAAGTSPFCTTVLTDAKPSTDAVVVRHAETCVAGSGTGECAAVNGTDLYIQVSRCGTDTATYVLSTTGFGLHNRDCDTATPTIAPIRKFSQSIYYVKTVTNADGSTTPTLMRSTMANAAHTTATTQALVDNIEGFRIEYGVDSISDSGAAVTQTAAIAWADPKNKKDPTNRGDGVPDGQYIRCTQAAPCSATQMLNTVAVKIYVLARTERRSPGHTDDKVYRLGSAATACANAAAADSDATCAPVLGPFNDGYKRHLFTQTVRLVNVSGRRETP